MSTHCNAPLITVRLATANGHPVNIKCCQSCNYSAWANTRYTITPLGIAALVSQR